MQEILLSRVETKVSVRICLGFENTVEHRIRTKIIGQIVCKLLDIDEIF